MQEEDKEIIRVDCDCGHLGHFFSLRRWDEGEILAVVCEATRDIGFWRRLKSAIGYLFNHHHLNYTEVILDREVTLQKIHDAILKDKPTNENI